jgi:small subunit ribosomal protein S17
MNTRRRLQGVVKKSNSEKTVVVEISRSFRHPLYEKVMRTASTMKVHDAIGCKVGDQVQIVESQPISKTKRWSVEKRLNVEENLAAQDVLPEVTAEELLGEESSEDMVKEIEEESDDSA